MNLKKFQIGRFDMLVQEDGAETGGFRSHGRLKSASYEPESPVSLKPNQNKNYFRVSDSIWSDSLKQFKYKCS